MREGVSGGHAYDIEPAAKRLRDGGRIINLSSVAHMMAVGGTAARQRVIASPRLKYRQIAR